MDLLDLPQSERAGAIRSACAEDDSLRVEVESLLAAHDAAAGFLGSPTAAVGAGLESGASARRGPRRGAGAATSSDAISERPGMKIGPYKLLQQIGEGGFGTVFVADQEWPVRRRVALKIIKPGMDSRQVIARFEQERQALALMDHPHVARVFDAGATESGRPYFVMEYVKGDPITAFADAHKLSLRARIELFAQVCQAVQHAHTKGLIHRDLKPRNILVSMSDGRPFAKVIDFGIAKATGAQLTDKTIFTEHHQLVGTPEYMSPEQAEGSLDIDTRTDVYSLGVLLYELLTGATPFDADRLRSAALVELQRIIREEDPPAPSLRLSRSLKTIAAAAAVRQEAPERIGTVLRGELDWIVMKALEKDRSRRYESPSMLAADVQRYLDGAPVLAAPPTWRYRAAKFSRKHKGQVAAIGAVAFTLVIGLIGTSIMLSRALAAEHDAQVAAQDALDQRGRAEAALVNEARERDKAEWETYAARIAFAQYALITGRGREARDRLDECPEDKRDWEWRFLKQQAMAIFTELQGHYEGAEFSPDGSNVLTRSGSIVQVWDLAGNRIAEMRHDKSVNMAGFSPDGHRVLTMSADGIARTWKIDRGVEPVILREEKDKSAVCTVAFSPDGRRVLTASNDGIARIWNADGAGETIALRTDVRGNCSATFSPDGRRILITSADSSVWIWDADGLDKPVVLRDQDGGVSSAVFSPDGTRVLTRSRLGARLWNLSSVTGTGLPHEHVASAIFSPDGAQVLTWSAADARLWNLSGKLGAVMPHEGIESAVFSPDATRVLTWSVVDARLWDSSGNPGAVMRHDAGWMGTAVFSPDGLHVLTTPADGTARLWDVTGQCVAVGEAPEIRTVDALAVSFSANGQWVILRGITTCLVRADQLDRPRYSMDAFERHIDSSVSAGGPVDSAILVDSPLSVNLGPTRRVVAQGGSRISFIDVSTDREVAMMSLPAHVVSLCASDDCERLILRLSNESTWVLDAREPESRRADLRASQAERAAVEALVDSLLTGIAPRESLEDALRIHLTGQPVRLAAARHVLQARLAEIDRKAKTLFDQMAQRHFTVARMVAALESLEANPIDASVHASRIRESIRARAAGWIPDASGLRKRAWATVLWPSTRERLDAALDAAREAVRIDPESAPSLTVLGAALHRVGENAEALAVLRRAVDQPQIATVITADGQWAPRRDVDQTESLMTTMVDGWALIAMCQARLGLQDDARQSLARLRESMPEANQIEGRVTERTLNFRYFEPEYSGGESTRRATSGEAHFELSSDGHSLTGAWRSSDDLRHGPWRDWNGVRRSGDAEGFDGLWATTGGALWLFTDGDRVRGYYSIGNLVEEAVMLAGGEPSTRRPPEVTQWASRVVAFSSQYSAPGWAASQVLNEPDTFAYQDSTTAWAPLEQSGGIQTVSLEFPRPVHATGVTIRETLCNGFVVQIDVIDETGALHTAWSGDDRSRPGKPVDFFAPFDRTLFLVKGVKIYVDTDRCGSWEEIDAVKLHGILPSAEAD